MAAVGGQPVGLQVVGVHAARGGRSVLRGASVAVRRGEIVALAGASGSGKSTLLRCVTRLVAVSSGSVLLDGVDVRSVDACALRRRVGLVAQTPFMLPGTVAENVAYGGCSGVDGALLAAGLPPGEFGERAAAELSGGERARVAFARALARSPDALLLDEPTAALDAEASATVAVTLRGLAARGLAIVVATHDRAFAAEVADRVVTLRDGVVA